MNQLIAKIKKLPIMQHKWVQFLIYLVKNFIDDNCTQKASSLTYTTLLSIVPIFTLVVVILSSIPQLAEAKEQIQNVIFSNLLPSTSFQVAKYINQFAANSSNLTMIGLGILFFTTISTLITIETAFNQIWRVEKKETTMLNLLRYWAIITLAPFVLGTAFIVSSTVQSLSFLNQKVAGYSIDWAVWIQVGSIVVMTLGFVAMYWFVPRAQVRFKHALVAGVIVGIIFELLKQSFGLIVENFTSYKAVYGAFAILPLFLLWIYISWNVILLGVEISYCLTIFETKKVHPRHALFSLMDMLNVMYREHKKGHAVSEAGLRDVLGRQEMPNWFTYVSFLQDNNLIASSDKDEYILKRSLNDYTFWDFYKNLPYPLPHSKDLKKLQTHAPWNGQWINTLARGEALLQQNFNIPLADIFDQIEPRQTPDPKDIEQANKGTGKGENSLAATREKSGLSGGQVSDVVNEDKRIKDTDKEQAAGFDGTLDFDGHGSLGADSGNATLNSKDGIQPDNLSNRQVNQLGQTGSTSAVDTKRIDEAETLSAPKVQANFIRNDAIDQSTQRLPTRDTDDNTSSQKDKDNGNGKASRVTTRLGQTISQTVRDKITPHIENLGDSTGVRAKLRQLNPIHWFKNRLGKKDPTIITDDDKPMT